MSTSFNNSDCLQMFQELSVSNESFSTEKILPFNDHSDIDSFFLKKYLNNNVRWLDIGSGSGLCVNKLSDCYKSLTCVEPIKEYARHIKKNNNVTVCNTTVEDFFTSNASPSIKYDVISIFGVMQYFSKEEAQKIYNLISNFAHSNSRVIIKQQFGVNDNVLINNYSKEMNRHYFSEYRSLETEIEMLKKARFEVVEKVDIYPAEFNRFQNTHFYALVSVFR